MYSPHQPSPVACTDEEAIETNSGLIPYAPGQFIEVMLGAVFGIDAAHERDSIGHKNLIAVIVDDGELDRVSIRVDTCQIWCYEKLKGYSVVHLYF